MHMNLSIVFKVPSFLACLSEVQESYCTTSGVGVGFGVGVSVS